MQPTQRWNPYFQTQSEEEDAIIGKLRNSQDEAVCSKTSNEFKVTSESIQS